MDWMSFYVLWLICVAIGGLIGAKRGGWKWFFPGILLGGLLGGWGWVAIALLTRKPEERFFFWGGNGKSQDDTATIEPVARAPSSDAGPLPCGRGSD